MRAVPEVGSKLNLDLGVRERFLTFSGRKVSHELEKLEVTG